MAEGLTGGKETDGSVKEYIRCTLYNEMGELLQKIFSSDSRQYKVVEVEHDIFLHLVWLVVSVILPCLTLWCLRLAGDGCWLEP